jgi:4-hydroxy-3-methylbut-2-enyl diphosphate reductase
VETGAIRHQPIGTKTEVITESWLSQARSIGVTAGASTPNNKVGETIARICAVAGVDLERGLTSVNNEVNSEQ